MIGALKQKPRLRSFGKNNATYGGMYERLSFILALAIFLAGVAIGTMSAPAQAQYGYHYPPPPQNIYTTPSVGAEYALGLLPG